VYKLNGIIFYYSGSGNTKLACEYISKHLNDVDIELFDIVKSKEAPDLNGYDIVGFASFTDFFSPPYLFEQYVKSIPEQKEKMAFMFSTYGNWRGKTLSKMATQVTSRGFRVVAGYSLKTPESYPPAIKRGIGDQTNPQEKHMEGLRQFLGELNEIINLYSKGIKIDVAKIDKGGLLGFFFGNMSRRRARKAMGEIFLDESLCTDCGICEEGCPYSAISLNPKPQFDVNKCYGCWWCFNHCPTKAIYTKKIRGKWQYPKPNKQFRKKMKVEP